MTAENFKKVFLPMHRKLFGIAFAMTGNADDAEDILQDLYVKLWNRRGELEEVNNREAYCVTLVRNMSIDLIRAKRPSEAVEHSIAATEESPETAAVNRDELRLISSLIDRLPKNQRQVIRLHGIENLTMEEIELVTGFSSSNVRTLLSRARKFIKEQYIKLTGYEQF